MILFSRLSLCRLSLCRLSVFGLSLWRLNLSRLSFTLCRFFFWFSLPFRRPFCSWCPFCSRCSFCSRRPFSNRRPLSSRCPFWGLGWFKSGQFPFQFLHLPLQLLNLLLLLLTGGSHSLAVSSQVLRNVPDGFLWFLRQLVQTCHCFHDFLHDSGFF
uniref:Secreted protein n=1 Tax=Cacopsylla melanoneura TaxID=428564 RepID=A0A8D8Z3Q7_9HEMI